MSSKKRNLRVKRGTKYSDNGERFITDFFKLVDKQSKPFNFKIKTEPKDVEDVEIKCKSELMPKVECDVESKVEIKVKLEPELKVVIKCEPDTDKSYLNTSISHRIELTDDDFDDIYDDEYVPKKGSRKRVRVITDYFPVRRSRRRPENVRKEDERRDLERQINNAFYEPSGLAIKEFVDKGRGIVAEKFFSKGDFVVEYIGDLINMHEAKRREEMYAQDNSAGCYMYYFKYNDIQYCIDATEENGTFGRLVNHSRNGNLVTKVVPINNLPRLTLFAKNSIKPGEELTYDYGDRSKQSLANHPWLSCCKFVGVYVKI